MAKPLVSAGMVTKTLEVTLQAGDGLLASTDCAR